MRRIDKNIWLSEEIKLFGESLILLSEHINKLDDGNKWLTNEQRSKFILLSFQ